MVPQTELNCTPMNSGHALIRTSSCLCLVCNHTDTETTRACLVTPSFSSECLLSSQSILSLNWYRPSPKWLKGWRVIRENPWKTSLLGMNSDEKRPQARIRLRLFAFNQYFHFLRPNSCRSYAGFTKVSGILSLCLAVGNGIFADFDWIHFPLASIVYHMKLVHDFKKQPPLMFSISLLIRKASLDLKMAPGQCR